MDKSNVIANYSKILDSYISKYSEPFKQILDSQRSKHTFILSRLYRFYYFSTYISDLKIAAKGHDRILLTVFAKCSLDLLGIFSCLNNGLEIQATVIFRSLFESYINVELMLRENADERIQLFAEYEHVQRWNHIQSHKKLYEKGYEDKFDMPEEDLEVYKQNYDQVISKYNVKRPYHWAWKIFEQTLNGQNPSLRSICEYLGPEFEKDYVQAYGTDSMIAHGSPILKDYFTTRETNRTVNTPKFTESVNYLGALTIVYCSAVIKSILKYLKVNQYADLKVFMDYYCNEVLFHKY